MIGERKSDHLRLSSGGQEETSQKVNKHSLKERAERKQGSCTAGGGVDRSADQHKDPERKGPGKTSDRATPCDQTAQHPGAYLEKPYVQQAHPAHVFNAAPARKPHIWKQRKYPSNV